MYVFVVLTQVRLHAVLSQSLHVVNNGAVTLGYQIGPEPDFEYISPTGKKMVVGSEKLFERWSQDFSNCGFAVACSYKCAPKQTSKLTFFFHPMVLGKREIRLRISTKGSSISLIVRGTHPDSTRPSTQPPGPSGRLIYLLMCV